MHAWHSSRPVGPPELELDVIGSGIVSDPDSLDVEDDVESVDVVGPVVGASVVEVDDASLESPSVVEDVGSGTRHSVSHVVLDPPSDVEPSAPTTW